MDETTAIRLARKFIADSIEFTSCQESPPELSIYSVDPEHELVIHFSFDVPPNVGASGYVIISERDGSARLVACLGE
jgi:hypothetical protein